MTDSTGASTDSAPPAPARSVAARRGELIHLEPGVRVRMKDGSERAVVNNPNDGVWIVLDDGSDAGELVSLGEVDAPIQA